MVDVESNVDEKTGGRPTGCGGMSKKIIFLKIEKLLGINVIHMEQ